MGYARGGSVARVAWQFTGAHDLLETESYFHSLYGVLWPLRGSKYTGQNRCMIICMYVCTCVWFLKTLQQIMCMCVCICDF